MRLGSAGYGVVARAVAEHGVELAQHSHRHALRDWIALTRYSEDGRLKIDNNGDPATAGGTPAERLVVFRRVRDEIR